jgi:exonuclease SbcC
MIKSIYLENWKTHLESKLDFKKGANILLGIIGSGKSSIVDAICYALYGTYPSLSNRKISLDETIMFKPSKKDFFKVVLEFELENKLYLIEREVYSGNKSNSAKLYFEDKLIAGPKKTDVDLFVSKLLGIDYNLFIKVVYSHQNEIDYFLKIVPSKRKEQFDDLFGISHFEKIKVATRDIDRVLSIELNKKDALSNQIIDQLSNINYNELLDKEKQSISILDDVNLKINSIDSKVKEVSDNLNNLKQIKLKFEKINLDYKSNLTRLSDLNNDLSVYLDKFTKESLVSDKENLSKLEIEYKQKQDENNKFVINKKDIENKTKFYKNEISITENKIKYLNLSLIKDEFSFEKLSLLKNTKLKEIDLLKETKISYLSKINDINKSISELSKGYSKCPVCDTNLSVEKINLLLSSKKDNLNKINLLLTEIYNQLLINQKEVDHFILVEKNIEKNKFINSQILEFNKIVLDKKTLLSSFEKELSLVPVIVNLDVIVNTISDLKKMVLNKEEYFKLILKKNELELKVVSLEKELALINYNEDKYLKVFSEFNNFDSILKDLKDKSKIYSEILLTVKSQINNYTTLSLKKDEILKSQKSISNKKQDLSYFLKAIDISQLQLRKILIDNINQALSIIWPKIYPYKDYLSARLNTSNDYILEVLTLKNKWIRVEGILSGGERACASLSIRIAISLILTKKLGLLILDEPTHNLDVSSVEALAMILGEELPDLVDQIFIVTHDQKLLETLNSNKFIIERDKENDGVSKVVI